MHALSEALNTLFLKKRAKRGARQPVAASQRGKESSPPPGAPDAAAAAVGSGVPY